MIKVLGISGSPRKGGNTNHLLKLFMDQMAANRYQTQTLDAVNLKMNACIGCGHCETKGTCIFKDEFTTVFLPAINAADIIVISSPVYFYGFPAQLKILIDRIQVMWSRKYRLKTDEFKGHHRKGILLAVGATNGKDLFDGLKLTARYFFDAADIEYYKSLFYRGIDQKKDIKKVPTLIEDIKKISIFA